MPTEGAKYILRKMIVSILFVAGKGSRLADSAKHISLT